MRVGLSRGCWAVCGCVGVWSVEWRMWVGVCGGGGWGWGVKECVWRGGGCAVHVGMCGACGVCECVCYTFLFLTVKSLIKIGFGSLKTEWMHFTACLARSGEPF